PAWHRFPSGLESQTIRRPTPQVRGPGTGPAVCRSDGRAVLARSAVAARRGDRTFAGEISECFRPLLLGGTEPGGGGKASRLERGHGGEPAVPGAQALIETAGAARRAVVGGAYGIHARSTTSISRAGWVNGNDD